MYSAGAAAVAAATAAALSVASFPAADAPVERPMTRVGRMVTGFLADGGALEHGLGDLLLRDGRVVPGCRFFFGGPVLWDEDLHGHVRERSPDLR